MKKLSTAIFISLLLTGCGTTKDDLGATMTLIDPVVQGRVFERFPIINKCLGISKEQYILESGEAWREGVSLAKHTMPYYVTRDDARRWGLMGMQYAYQKMLKDHSDTFLKGLTGKEREECMTYYNTPLASR